MTDIPIQQPSQRYQPLQGDQCSSDEIYDDLTKLELTGAENELDPMANVHTQRRSLEPIQGDNYEINPGMIKKEAELDNVKAAVKKIKMVLIATVIANIVLLVMITIVVIVISVPTQVDILQMHVARLQIQVSDIHPCGQGEWRRVAYLDMGDPTQQCPSAWREYNTGRVRACGRPSTSGGSCPATTYSIDFQYRRVCGRVVGYQFGSTDGFYRSGNINQQYVDGISITRGSPRQHVWTYVSGWSERQINDGNCPCSTRPGREGPLYVGNNYYCESGSPSYPLNNHLYSSDKLWDGKQCEGSCCTGTDTPPWFNVQFNTTASDDIEVRICGSESTMNEDTPIELIEIYGAL